MSVRRLPALAAVLLSFVVRVPAASAHEFQPCVLDVHELDGGRYEVTWKAASGGAESASAPAPSPTFPPHCRREEPAELDPDTGPPTRWTLACGPPGLAGHRISVVGLSPGITDALVRFTAADGAEISAMLRADSPSLVLPGAALGARSRLAVASTYLGAGIEHLLGGWDHLLFILGLVLLVYLPPLDAQGNPTLPVKLARPLDFAAVTDHSEYLGETSLCSTPGSPAYESATCQSYRPPMRSYLDFEVGIDPPVRSDICGGGGTVCTDAAGPVWNAIQDAAEGAYDRSEACAFTTFVAYEYSLAPFGTNLHRNVIFRNAKALPAPLSVCDAPSPLELWRLLDEGCNQAGTGCDVLAIPHNSNLSNGRMFEVEYPGAGGVADEKEQAARRARMEPLAEIYQHKGDSECINGLATVPGAPDELCEFEKLQKPPLIDCGVDGVGYGAFGGVGCTSWRDYLRNTLASGLQEEVRIGENPYKLGIIASTDTHNGTPGKVDERTFQGHLGISDQRPEDQLAGVTLAVHPLIASPGGLAGVWAEENARDSIFDALRRRETFGTSGPRLTVRLFGGWGYPDDACGRADMVSRGYHDGVPMGGDLPARPAGSGAPRLIASAMRDPGSAEGPGTPLQRLQIIKVWAGADGTAHEKVFDVAGDAGNGATVDPVTCQPQGAGADTLCAVWADPEFDATSHVAYYLRVVENPTCRWSSVVCASLPPAQQAALKCDDLGVPKTVQERAWSSPIWYAP